MPLIILKNPKLYLFNNLHIFFADVSAPLDPRTDVIFLMDGSGDIGLVNFKRQQQFVKSLAKSFKISVSGPRAGIVAFGRFAYPMIRLTDYSSQADFLDKVDNTRLINGERRMDLGLKEAANMLSQEERDGPKVVILLSGGTNSDKPGVQALDVAMRPLADLGARIYVVGAGASVSTVQLRQVVDRANDMFVLPSFISLPSKARNLAQHVSSTYGE